MAVTEPLPGGGVGRSGQPASGGTGGSGQAGWAWWIDDRIEVLAGELAGAVHAGSGLTFQQEQVRAVFGRLLRRVNPYLDNPGQALADDPGLAVGHRCR